jgi:hypothetical protein
VEIKSANQRWKESNTTLSFKDWISREKEKYASATGNEAENFIANKHLNQNIQDTLKKVEYANATGELKTELENKTIFGLNKNIILFSGLIIISAIAYKFYKSKK